MLMANLCGLIADELPERRSRSTWLHTLGTLYTPRIYLRSDCGTGRQRLVMQHYSSSAYGCLESGELRNGAVP
jgi:hypothetical protein